MAISSRVFITAIGVAAVSVAMLTAGTIDIHASSGNRAHAPVFILKVNKSGDFVIKG